VKREKEGRLPRQPLKEEGTNRMKGQAHPAQLKPEESQNLLWEKTVDTFRTGQPNKRRTLKEANDREKAERLVSGRNDGGNPWVKRVNAGTEVGGSFFLEKLELPATTLQINAMRKGGSLASQWGHLGVGKEDLEV